MKRDCEPMYPRGTDFDKAAANWTSNTRERVYRLSNFDLDAYTPWTKAQIASFDPNTTAGYATLGINPDPNDGPTVRQTFKVVDRHGRLLAYCMPLGAIDGRAAAGEIERLAIQHVEPNTPRGSKAGSKHTRGNYAAVSWNLWTRMQTEEAGPRFNVDMLEALPASWSYLQALAPHLDRLSEAHTHIQPRVARRLYDARRFIPAKRSLDSSFTDAGLNPPRPMQPLGGLQFNVTTNLHMDTTYGATTPHRDISDIKGGLTWVIPFGNFAGGEPYLHEAQVKLNVPKGYAYAILSQALTHSNAPISRGLRGSIVTYL